MAFPLIIFPNYFGAGNPPRGCPRGEPGPRKVPPVRVAVGGGAPAASRGVFPPAGGPRQPARRAGSAPTAFTFWERHGDTRVPRWHLFLPCAPRWRASENDICHNGAAERGGQAAKRRSARGRGRRGVRPAGSGLTLVGPCVRLKARGSIFGLCFISPGARNGTAVAPQVPWCRIMNRFCNQRQLLGIEVHKVWREPLTRLFVESFRWPPRGTTARARCTAVEGRPSLPHTLAVHSPFQCLTERLSLGRFRGLVPRARTSETSWGAQRMKAKVGDILVSAKTGTRAKG